MARRVKIIDSPDFRQPLTAELLGQAIKAKRTQSSLRLEDAAALCGVSKQTYMNIEHGNDTCQFANVLKICAGLGIKLYVSPWTDSDEGNHEWQ